jgi:predicted component of type VI protein secretion system
MTEERKMRHDEVAEWVTRTRQAQGLPDRIEDPATLHKLAALVIEAAEVPGCSEPS